MKDITVKFSRQLDVEFSKTLRKRVNQYFKDNNTSIHANTKMVIKTVFMIALYFVPYGLMVSGVFTNTWAILGLWLVMAFGMSGIGLSIMHDANHGSYSKNKKVNYVLSYLINLVGGNTDNWQMQHNVLHHSFTNIEGSDEDMDSAFFLRFSPHKEKHKIHRFQFIYAWFFYGLLTLAWATFKEFVQIRRFYKTGVCKSKKDYQRIMAKLVFWKLFYFFYIIAIPIIAVPEVSPWITIVGFIMMHFVAGVILSSIFQSAHIMPECEYPMPDEKREVKSSWMVHQLLNTCNFAQNNKALTWFVGGLNYQVEHHLFPNICHIHYSDLSKIVKKTAEEFNIPYYSHPTFRAALAQHGKMLYNLGR